MYKDAGELSEILHCCSKITKGISDITIGVCETVEESNIHLLKCAGGSLEILSAICEGDAFLKRKFIEKSEIDIEKDKQKLKEIELFSENEKKEKQEQYVNIFSQIIIKEQDIINYKELELKKLKIKEKKLDNASFGLEVLSNSVNQTTQKLETKINNNQILDTKMIIMALAEGLFETAKDEITERAIPMIVGVIENPKSITSVLNGVNDKNQIIDQNI